MLDRDSVRANAAAVEERIAAACARAGRARSEVTLVAVTKTFPAIAIDYAVAAGVTNVGENRVQEARDKKPLVRGSARWHLIGHLQSNKAKVVNRICELVHSLDSHSAAERVRRFFSVSRASAFSIPARARAIAPSSRSCRMTGCPATAATCAIPLPMGPAPRTPTQAVSVYVACRVTVR